MWLTWDEPHTLATAISTPETIAESRDSLLSLFVDLDMETEDAVVRRELLINLSPVPSYLELHGIL
jgi:hypothetical protein